MLNFTVHAAGNELISFTAIPRYYPPSSYRYRGFTVIFLPLPREYPRNFPIYRGNTARSPRVAFSDQADDHNEWRTHNSLKAVRQS